METTDKTIRDAVEECESMIRKMKIGLIICTVLLCVLIADNIYTYEKDKPEVPVLTTATAIKFEMAKGLIVDMTVAELLEYAVEEKWKYDMADEER